MSEIWIDGARRLEAMRAHGIAAMGRVSRDMDGFTVYATDPAPDAFRVWDDPHVGLRCTCERFDRAAARGDDDACEHVMAVELTLDPPEDGIALELPTLERRAV